MWSYLKGNKGSKLGFFINNKNFENLIFELLKERGEKLRIALSYHTESSFEKFNLFMYNHQTSGN